jgi:hypothetical protein
VFFSLLHKAIHPSSSSSKPDQGKNDVILPCSCFSVVGFDVVGFNVQLDEVGLDVVGFNVGAAVGFGNWIWQLTRADFVKLIGVFYANLKWASVLPKC